MLGKTTWTAIALLGVVSAMGCSGARKSGENQSCQVTDDCEEGLVCVGGTCRSEESPPGMGGADGQNSGQQERVISGRGESCETRVDCEPGLACISGTCVVPDAPFTPTGMECQSTTCLTHRDCCLPPTSLGCQTYRTDCDAGDLEGCNNWEYYCNCTDSPAAEGSVGWECTEDSRCVFHKTCDYSEAELNSGFSYDCIYSSDSLGQNRDTCRDDGVCVECTSDLECGLEETCSGAGLCVECTTNDDCGNGTCAPTGICVQDRECWTDSDCLGSEQCSAEGKCVERGCVSDRQCADQFDSYEATCGADGDCDVPCDFDAECNPGGSYSGFICHEGSCVEAGCESDEECQALYGGSGAVYQCVAEEK